MANRPIVFGNGESSSEPLYARIKNEVRDEGIVTPEFRAPCLDCPLRASEWSGCAEKCDKYSNAKERR
jgi:hypothetical protein